MGSLTLRSYSQALNEGKMTLASKPPTQSLTESPTQFSIGGLTAGLIWVQSAIPFVGESSASLVLSK